MEDRILLKYFLLDCKTSSSSFIKHPDPAIPCDAAKHQKRDAIKVEVIAAVLVDTSTESVTAISDSSAVTDSSNAAEHVLVDTSTESVTAISDSSNAAEHVTNPVIVTEDPSTNAKILDLLNRHRASYRTLSHAPTRTSQESADVRGVPLSSGSKAMLLRGKKNSLPGGKTFCLAVLSASSKADLKKLKQILKVKEISMATEQEVKTITGCIPGAVPPFGSLFEGVVTVADNSLNRQGSSINFNAGLRTESILGLSTQSYYEIEKPLSADFSTEAE